MGYLWLKGICNYCTKVNKLIQHRQVFNENTTILVKCQSLWRFAKICLLYQPEDINAFNAV